MSKLQDRARGCLLGLAIGDALGRETEFIRSRQDILEVTGGKGVVDLPDSALYTDDTQMTICIANALIAAGRQDMDGFMKVLTKEFVSWYDSQNDPAQKRAPGNTCMTACANLKHGVNWGASGISTSLGSGSAMRSAPIGLYYFGKVEKIVYYAINSSLITHSAELALCSSVGTALLTNLALGDEEPVGCWANELVKVASINQEFKQCIRKAADAAAVREDPDYVLSKDCLGEGWTGHSAIASALYCCMMHPDSYEKAVLMGANAIGDSDTIACIAGAWMGARHGIAGIPSKWHERIEDRDRLIQLADKLLEATGVEARD